MSSEPTESTEESSPLPKATVPVRLAPLPANPAAAGSSAQELAEPQMQEVTAAQQEVEHPTKPVGFAAWLRSLNVLEKFCCIMIVCGVVGFAALVFLPAIFDQPEQTEFVDSGDFPIKGKQVEVQTAETYWRKPVVEGANADAVRAGMALIPVLDVKLSGKGSIHIFFRDADGKVAGDLVTHELKQDGELSAACTVGFDHQSGFTAYQSGTAGLWSVEFHEVPDGVNQTGKDTLLFQMNISSTLK